MTDSNKKTPLYDSHLAAGARMVPFGGWDMPVQYSGIISEVESVRTKVGLFDVSHMGRMYISGSSATEFLDWMLTGSASTLRIGRARYCMICNPSGGVIDDTIFYKLEEQNYLLIPNAGNRDAVVSWFNDWNEKKFANGCNILDRTCDTGLLAVQGPDAAFLMDELCALADGVNPSSIRLFACGQGFWRDGKLKGKPVFIGRTGYTGEDGFEIILSAKEGPNAWRHLETSGAIPCGLGARDVLRLEAGLLLHGNDMDQTVNPYEAGLQTFVESDREGYIARDALLAIEKNEPSRRLIGFVIEGKKIARGGCPIMDDGEEIGNVTSGVPSPTLGVNIGMGFVRSDRAEPGTFIDINIRGEEVAAKVTRLPFYRRSKKS